MKSCYLLPIILVLLVGVYLTVGEGISESASKSTRSRRPLAPILRIIRQGAYRGLEECREQFKNEIWNCSLDDNQVHARFPIFVKATLPYATRETAFVHAISSAAITYEISSQCRQNRIQGCSCVKLQRRPGGNKNWKWGGCSDNIDFGENKTKQYIDNLEKGHDARTAFNLHNNDVGRKVVRSYLRRECKCHGVSGSCQFKTCWRQLEPFNMVATELKMRYEQAVQVTFIEGKLQERVDNGYRPVSRRVKQLVYLEPSPDYCVKNKTAGALGVLGRTCSSEDTPVDDCVALCNSCRMKHKTVNHYQETKCRCTFVWCCRIECETCIRESAITTCTKR